MAQGRPSRGESFTENLQDYVEESIQNSTDLPDTGATRDQGQSAGSMRQPQTEQMDSSMPSNSPGSTTTSNITPGTEAALDEHLAATENVRGAAQSGAMSPGAAGPTSTAVQDEARQRITDRTNDELGMGNIRS
jgi:hypothetical protein